jgi:hypothetical protein
MWTGSNLLRIVFNIRISRTRYEYSNSINEGNYLNNYVGLREPEPYAYVGKTNWLHKQFEKSIT